MVLGSIDAISIDDVSGLGVVLEVVKEVDVGTARGLVPLVDSIGVESNCGVPSSTVVF